MPRLARLFLLEPLLAEDAFGSDDFKRQSRILHDEPQMILDHENGSTFAPRHPFLRVGCFVGLSLFLYISIYVSFPVR